MIDLIDGKIRTWHEPYDLHRWTKIMLLIWLTDIKEFDMKYMVERSLWKWYCLLEMNNRLCSIMLCMIYIIDWKDNWTGSDSHALHDWYALLCYVWACMIMVLFTELRLTPRIFFQIISLVQIALHHTQNSSWPADCSSSLILLTDTLHLEQVLSLELIYMIRCIDYDLQRSYLTA